MPSVRCCSAICRDGKFAEIGLGAGQPLSRRYVARGTATADFLNNGSEDLLVTVLDGSPVLLRNQSARKGTLAAHQDRGQESPIATDSGPGSKSRPAA